MIALLAHLETTGYGAWGDGMARLFLEPTELLLVVALVLLAAQSGRPCSDRLPLLLPLVWLLGGLIGISLPAPLRMAVACTAVLAAAGLLVALGIRLALWKLLPLVAAMAGMVALVGASDFAGHPGALGALLGESVAVAVLTTLLCLLLAPPHPPGLAIAVRLGGSSITAAALVILGGLVRHPQ